MEYFITYYYNLRFFSPDQLPISVASPGPRYFFHTVEDPVFIDKRGVVNGVSLLNLHSQYLLRNYHLKKTCPCKDPEVYKDDDCPFKKNYYIELSKTFPLALSQMTRLAHTYHAKEIILLVYEKPDNPCSERIVLKKVFKEHGLELKEWERPHSKYEDGFSNFLTKKS